MSATSDSNRDAPLVRLVAALLAQIDGTAVTECEFRSGAQRVLVRRAPTSGAVQTVEAAHEATTVLPSWQPIVAPLAGVYYAAESPQAPPLIATGRTVSVGQRVGLIESMKLFNAVESDVSGIVQAILVLNGAVVEKGQILMYVEPLGDPA